MLRPPDGPGGTTTTMTTQYLSYGIADVRTHTDQELMQLRTLELARAERRRARRGSLLRFR